MALAISTIDDLNAAFDQIVSRIERSTEPGPGSMPEPTSPEPATQINVDLLRRALEHVTENPTEHDQRIWARRSETGIVGCLAYHAARLAGHTMDWDRPGNEFEEICFFCFRDHRDECSYVVANNAEGRTHLFEAARTALGLDSFQANRLFAPRVSLERQWELAEEFTHGAIVRKDNV